MHYLALASDYDGTLARNGRVDEPTILAIERLVASGRKFILVTGRELRELRILFPRLDLCAKVVAENGAVLYTPETGTQRIMAPPPPKAFLDALKATGVVGVTFGTVMVATSSAHKKQVRKIIKETRVNLQIILNNNSLMVLPLGLDKATGLSAALEELGLSFHSVVGVGDAENDVAFLERCGCAIAVANALADLKATAAWVTTGNSSVGVRELILHLITNDLAGIAFRANSTPDPR